MVLRQARRLAVPAVASFHTDVPGYLQSYGYGLLARPAWRYLRWLHSHACLNLCPSAATMAQLEAHGLRDLALWSRGVDARAFSPAHRSVAWRQRLSAGDVTAPLLLYVGRLAAEKRVSWFGPLLEAVPGVRLALVGDGPAAPRLRRQLGGKPVHFAGILRGPDLSAAYASADVFVFPSATETFGNVVLEAGASGLPAVATHSGGVPDIVTDGVNGRIVAADDLPGFIEAVRRLVSDPHGAQRLGEAARRAALERSWSVVLDGLLERYAKCLRAHAPRAER